MTIRALIVDDEALARQGIREFLEAEEDIEVVGEAESGTQALAQIEQIRPRRAYLTHIAHDVLHADLEARLPEHVFLSFDGLVISCAGG